MVQPYYVYILRCQDDSLYIGMTNDLVKRLKAHTGVLSGGAKYTRSHPVAALEAAWKFPEKGMAARTEYALKKLTRKQKLCLLSAPDTLCPQYVPWLKASEVMVCSPSMLRTCFAKAKPERIS
jgi:putative endonuclease